MLTLDGQLHSGWVYTIDPVSQSVTLLQFTGRQHDNKIKHVDVILGHFVQSIQVIDDNTEAHSSLMDALFKPAACHTDNLSTVEMRRRRDRVKKYLADSRVPVELSTENGDVISVGGVLFIHPPYTVDCCFSTNEIILGRIQKLLQGVPIDFSAHNNTITGDQF